MLEPVSSPNSSRPAAVVRTCIRRDDISARPRTSRASRVRYVVDLASAEAPRVRFRSSVSAQPLSEPSSWRRISDSKARCVLGNERRLRACPMCDGGVHPGRQIVRPHQRQRSPVQYSHGVILRPKQHPAAEPRGCNRGCGASRRMPSAFRKRKNALWRTMCSETAQSDRSEREPRQLGQVKALFLELSMIDPQLCKDRLHHRRITAGSAAGAEERILDLLRLASFLGSGPGANGQHSAADEVADARKLRCATRSTVPADQDRSRPCAGPAQSTGADRATVARGHCAPTICAWRSTSSRVPGVARGRA